MIVSAGLEIKVRQQVLFNWCKVDIVLYLQQKMLYVVSYLLFDNTTRVEQAFRGKVEFGLVIDIYVEWSQRKERIEAMIIWVQWRQNQQQTSVRNRPNRIRT